MLAQASLHARPPDFLLGRGFRAGFASFPSFTATPLVPTWSVWNWLPCKTRRTGTGRRQR
jgi:hypothetical protein